MDAPRGIERKAIKNIYYRISGGGVADLLHLEAPVVLRHTSASRHFWTPPRSNLPPRNPPRTPPSQVLVVVVGDTHPRGIGVPIKSPSMCLKRNSVPFAANNSK